MPGSGKSTLGAALAARLGVPFTDLDAFIEEMEESPVPELFRRKGENWFRQTEAAALRRLPVIKAGGVVATGGGTPCFAGNMRFMNETGCSIFLDVPVSKLLERFTEPGIHTRPLLAGKNKAEVETYLQETLTQRQEFYRQAKLIIKSGNAAEDKINEIINALQACS